MNALAERAALIVRAARLGRADGIERPWGPREVRPTAELLTALGVAPEPELAEEIKRAYLLAWLGRDIATGGEVA